MELRDIEIFLTLADALHLGRTVCSDLPRLRAIRFSDIRRPVEGSGGGGAMGATA